MFRPSTHSFDQYTEKFLIHFGGGAGVLKLDSLAQRIPLRFGNTDLPC